ncbi:MAG: UDP-N-acetylmuramate dehydrogenase [Oscillospiraceae bacterium]|jgi:UDP-N-acetylmuramate dehydrogenase|nr:UDP-N-acetylmuramate dehydrogenase [Oscillospiraceae bacterium]
MSDVQAAADAIRSAFPKLEVRSNEPMKNHTSLKIGGAVTAMLFPRDAAALRGVLALLSRRGVTPLILGNGTNLLVQDAPLELIVLKTTGLSGIRLSGGTIRADCGVTLSRLAGFAAERGLSGLEFAHGIPGTLGGAAHMNAGAYGGEMRFIVESAEVAAQNGRVFRLANAELDFSYRHSRFCDTGEVAASCVLRLHRGEPEAIRAKMNALAEKRRASQPLELPSAGSAFKRPAAGYAAALIEQSGLKGFSVGGAQVSEKHAGFIVNRGGASFSDVLGVLDHVRETVFRQSGAELSPEIKIIRRK